MEDIGRVVVCKTEDVLKELETVNNWLDKVKRNNAKYIIAKLDCFHPVHKLQLISRFFSEHRYNL